MSRLTKTFITKTRVVPLPTAKTITGYPAYQKTDKAAYLQMLMTNILGQTFYADKKEQVKESLNLHAGAVKDFPDFVGPAAVYARNKGYMRTQPVMAMAFLARAGHPDFEKLFDQVCLIPNDVIDFVSFYGTLANGSQGGRRVKRVIGKWLANKLTPFWIIKYGSEDHTGYSLKDLLITMHPGGHKGKGAMNPVLAEYIMHGTISEASELTQQIIAFEALKHAETEKQAVDAAIKGRLPHEVVTPFAGKFPGLWDAVAGTMPIMALMRNLNTLARHGAAEANKTRIAGVFANPEAVAKSKILPFQFMNAYDAVVKSNGAAWALDALRDAIDLSVGNIPAIFDNTVMALDQSSSMDGNYLRTGAVIGIALARKSESCTFYSFDTELETKSVSKRDSILTQADAVVSHAREVWANGTGRGATATNLPIEAMIDAAKHGAPAVNTLIVVTDGQQNHGRPFYEAVVEYRKRFN